jgi:polysaccharide chain length determinant protein (PEP-CTERM system associated)
MSQTTNGRATDQIQVFANTARHYAGWIVLATILFSVVGVTFVLLLPDHYKASTTILVDPQKVPEKYVSPTVSSDPAQRLSTITQQVLSSSRLQQIIDQMNLYPELRGKMSRDEIIETMRQYITITVKQGSASGLSAFTIEYEGSRANQVAGVANELAQSFIAWNVKNREQQSQDTTEFLDAEVDTAKASLEDQEKKVSTFKLQHPGEMPDQEQANLQVLAQLQNQFQTNAEALNRYEIERTMLVRGGGSDAVPTDLSKPAELSPRAQLEQQQRTLEAKLLELQRRYTDAHPAVIDAASRLQRVTEQVKALPPDPPPAPVVHDNSAVTARLEIVDKESKRLIEEQKQITAQINRYRSKVDAVPLREQQMAELNRNYAVSKEHYQSMFDKAYSARVASRLEQKQEAEHFTVLDAATVPEKPFKPQRRLLFPIVFLAAIALSVALAYLKDIISGSPRVESDLRALLPPTVPVLASIPRLTGRSDRRNTIRFAAVALALLLIGCAFDVAVFLRYHPKL